MTLIRHHSLLTGYYVPQYEAVLNKAVQLGYTLPSVYCQMAQNQLMKNLISTNNFFGLMDFVYVFQNDAGLDFGKINWKNPNAFLLNCPFATQPMWHRNLGWTGRPDLQVQDFYIDTGFIPNTHGVNWTLNSAGFFMSNFTGYTGSGYFMWCESGVTNTNRSLFYLFDGAVGYGMHSSTAAIAITAPQHFGVFSNERILSNNQRAQHSITGVVTLGSNAVVSTTRPTNSLKLFGFDLTALYPASVLGPNQPVQMVMGGAALTGAWQPEIYTIMQQYQSNFFGWGVGTASGNWTVPAGVSELFVECWGAGGAGRGYTNVAQTTTGAGGGGGAYAASTIAVTPSQVIPYTIGIGGAGTTSNGGNGGDTSWNSGQILAKGGAGASVAGGSQANGGLASACVGSIKYDGGKGGIGGGTLNSSTASGGSSAGALAAGVNGVNGVDGRNFAVRGGRALLGGASGVSQANTFNAAGSIGVFGCGGSGARRASGAPIGGAGGNGFIRVSVQKQY